jgi:hypothetical protein
MHGTSPKANTDWWAAKLEAKARYTPTKQETSRGGSGTWNECGNMNRRSTPHIAFPELCVRRRLQSVRLWNRSAESCDGSHSPSSASPEVSQSAVIVCPPGRVCAVIELRAMTPGFAGLWVSGALTGVLRTPEERG